MIGATITGGVSSVTKGDAGESAYEIAVRNGYTGTEEEWLASLSANATTATAAATSAQSSATAAAASASAAASSAESARSYMTAAATSAMNAQDDRQAAAASAATANTAAGTATEDAQYIAGQISGARMAADQAATSALNAQNSAGQAATSEANARVSEQNVALASTRIQTYYDGAITAATNASNSATEAMTIVSNLNIETEVISANARSASNSKDFAQQAAATAESAATRAEEALATALAPLSNYYTKSQTDNAINVALDDYATSSVVSGLSSSIASAERDISTLSSSVATLSTGVSRLNGLAVNATDETAGFVKLYNEPGTATDGAMTQAAVKSGIDAVQNALFAHVSWAEGKITQVYKFKGSVTYYARLPQSGMENGDVYNIRNGNQAAGIQPGDNVAWVAPHTEHQEGFEPATGTYDSSVTYYTDDTGATQADTSTTTTTYEPATGTYTAGTTYYTDSTGAETVDTTGFEEGVTDVTSYYVAVTTADFVAGVTDMSSYYVAYSRDVQVAGEWDKLSGIFILLPADSVTLGGVKIGDHVNVAADGTISISDASAATAGVLKLYTTTGAATDGTMTQAAISDALALKMNASDVPSVASAANVAYNIPTVSGSGNIWIS